jgi:hypothetical protein
VCSTMFYQYTDVRRECNTTKRLLHRGNVEQFENYAIAFQIVTQQNVCCTEETWSSRQRSDNCSGVQQHVYYFSSRCAAVPVCCGS